METLPRRELLEQMHQFPGPYVFKAIGRAEDGFAARVVAAAREALGESSDPPSSVRETAGGRHVSVTLQPTVQNVDQVLAVYQRLQGLAGLVTLF